MDRPKRATKAPIRLINDPNFGLRICRPWEESAQGPDQPNIVIPPKLPRNVGASLDNLDANRFLCLVISKKDSCFWQEMTRNISNNLNPNSN